jgi:hypothetical protein
MLTAPCGGVGGGIGGACGDCDGEYPLTATALTFAVVPLNTYVRFRTPGTYTFEASSADITTTPRDEKIGPALSVKSNTMPLTIVNDPGWAYSTARAYAGVYGWKAHQAGEFWTHEVRGRWQWKYSLQPWSTRRTNLFSCWSRVVEMAGPASRKTLPSLNAGHEMCGHSAGHKLRRRIFLIACLSPANYSKVTQ